MLPFKSILETNSKLLSPKTVILSSSPGAKIYPSSIFPSKYSFWPNGLF